MTNTPKQKTSSKGKPRISTVAVVGLGKVGSLVATLLHESDFQVTGFDARITEPTIGTSYPVKTCDVKKQADLKKKLSGFDAVVSCLPYNLNLSIAETAHSLGIHYFDLTEDVPTTKAIIQLAKTSQGVMAPQCGLAPGFIGIVGAHLTKSFKSCRSIELRVGALPQHPRGALGYAFNWSAEGVVNEYMNDCDVIQNGERKSVPPLEGLEKILIDGQELEAFTTSGGLGTMCETWAGKVQTLNYKTMRYAGHCEKMRFFLNDLHMAAHPKQCVEILTNACPPVAEDVVYVHAAVEGQKEGSQGGTLQRAEYVRGYYPIEIAGEMCRAISWTTAASVCAVVEMVSAGTLPSKGFIKQEHIPLDAFLATQTGGLYALSDMWDETGDMAELEGENKAPISLSA